MAKRKIEWSPEGIISLGEILDYYIEVNGNKKYSSLIAKEINKSVKNISQHNFIGKETDIENVRVLYHKYMLFFMKLQITSSRFF